MASPMGFRAFGLVCGVSTAMAAPISAWAQNSSGTSAAPIQIGEVRSLGVPELDTVILHDGTVLRGTVSELHPGTFVRFVLTDGTARTLSFTEIATTSGPGFPSTRQDIPPAFVGPDPYLTPHPGAVPLRVEHSPPLTLTTPVESYSIGGRPIFRDVCTTPCTLYVPPGPFTLHLRDSGGTGSNVNDLMVPPAGGIAHWLTVRQPPSYGGFVALVLLTVAGAMLAGGGAYLLTQERGGEIAIGANVTAWGGVIFLMGLIFASSGPPRPSESIHLAVEPNDPSP